MFTVYAEKDIFETLVVFKKEKPHWFNVLSKHSEICLNITEEELIAEEVQGAPIFEFILAGGRRPIPLKDYFDAISVEINIISEKPRSIFFLNVSKEEAGNLQNSYGVFVFGNYDIEDTILKGSFFKDLPKDSVFENQIAKGWKNLIDCPLPPANAMVVTDEYLFKNEENGEIVGKPNVIQLVDALLPSALDIPFHLTIITNDHDKSSEWCESLVVDLKTAIIDLRPYEIVFELVFTNTIHKRKIILNYVNSTSDKGFAVFRVKDGKTVRDDNDFRLDRIFNRVESQEGDTDYLVAESVLNQLKRKCLSVSQFISNAGETANNRILGDCNADKTLKNRLINDV